MRETQDDGAGHWGGGLGHIGVESLKALTGDDHRPRPQPGRPRTVRSHGAGRQDEGVELTRRAGSHYIIGYGGTVNVPTIDIISSERNIIGNLVGTYNDLAELMVLTAQGKVQLHTRTYPLDAVNDAMNDLDTGRLQGRGILVP